MASTRQNQIGLLNYLLGFGNAPGGGSQPSGANGGLPDIFRGLSGKGGAAGGGQSNDYLNGGANAGDRLSQFFGQMGMPQSGLQRQSLGGISQFLNQPAPEQRAFDMASPGLQEILQGGGPQFQRDLSLANQQGGRFGSANAILKGEAFKNMFNARDQAAQTLGMLSSAAGQNPFQRLLGGFGAGQQEAQQGDVETQRRLQLLMQLLGVGQQTAFNMPITQGPSFLDSIGQIAGVASKFVPGGGMASAAGGGGGGGWNPNSPI